MPTPFVKRTFFNYCILVSLLLLAFAIGYYSGVYNTMQNTVIFTSHKQQAHLKRSTNESLLSENVSYLSSDTKKLVKTQILPASTTPDIKINNVLTSPLTENSNVLEVLDYLTQLGQSDGPDASILFSETIERLTKLAETPENMQILLDFYINASEESRAPYYIANVIQNADITDKTIMVANLVDQLASTGTADANEKMIHLISSTGIHQQDERFVDALKNIVLYSSEQNNNKVFALDLLMPYQFDSAEKERLVNDFSFSLNQAPDHDKSYLVENILRFSTKNERTNIASNYLTASNDMATRIGTLSSLHMGTVEANDDLKTILFNIAQNSNDPLNTHAQNALLHVFELSYEEYSELKD